ncbi:single-stranded DNA-binding protein [uncultured Tyzzerella sp.]|uniref:single-stranded DNA-binding protein n=1 Tax=uncultured Tyzzerella sp. TaxID=2321398 RepID=UPI0029437BE2|nr:single-stranded DNA-binding protein [uncultured Tyzzerella sp.]
MQTDLRQNNIVTLIGKIISDYTFSHEMYGESFYTFKIETSRLSETSDILPITISERLIDKNLFKIGAIIEITGQIRSYNNIIDNKNHLVLTTFVKDINFNLDFNKNPNQVSLNGYVCKPPVYRKTPFGREIADVLLAVNRSYNKSDYIPCIIWGRNAKFASGLEVGNNIKVSGRMQSRNYQKKLDNGEVLEKTAYEISVSKLEVVEQNKDEN